MIRFFIKKQKGKDYYWKICVEKNLIIEEFGRLGLPGDKKTEDWGSNRDAVFEAEKRINQHKDDWFVEKIPPPEDREWYTELDDGTEEKFLNTLSKIKLTKDIDYKFNSPTSGESINLFELENNIILPNSLKLFLLQNNGGYILRQFTNKQHEHYFPNKNFESNINFREEITIKINSVAEISFLYSITKDYWGSKLIPFAKGWNGENIILYSVPNQTLESRVYASFHDEPPTDWAFVYDSFASFLIDYVNNNEYLSNKFIRMLGDDDLR